MANSDFKKNKLKLEEVKNPFGYEVPSISEIYQDYKYSGSYMTPHDAWEAARKAKNHYDEYHGEDEQNFAIEKKDRPCNVCGWPFKPNEQVTFTVTQPPKIKKYKYNYGKNSDKFRYKSSVVLKTDRQDGVRGYCNFIYYMYSDNLPTSKEIPIKEGDTVTGKTPFYYGSPSYGWYVFLNNIKVVNGDTEKSVSQPDKNPSNIFKQDGLAIVNPTKLFKKEMQSKKNPGETYFLYTAINSHDGYKYSWFSKRGDFTEGTGVIGHMDSIYNDSIKLKDVVLSSEYEYKEKPKKEEKPASEASTQSGPATFTASSLFKKEMQSKKNPGETYFLYTAKDENGQKYSWFSKGNFNDGDKVTGTIDGSYGSAIKLKSVRLAESKLREDIDNQSDDIDMFVRDWIDNLVKPYIYDHDVEGLASELASVTDRIVEWDSDEVIDELGYEPDWDLFREICDNIVEETVGELTYKEGFEDLNDLFCDYFGESLKNRDVRISESSEDPVDFYYSLLSESKYRLDEMFDEVSWRKSKKGQEEREWWMNHCHAETENRWRNKRGTQNLFACDDADESIMRFGKFYVDETTGLPIEVNYVASLLKSWGEPLKKVKESEEPDFDKMVVYQVVKDSDLGSSLDAETTNIKPTVVSEFDCEDCAEAKAEELNDTVTAGEKAVLGTEYSVQKKEIDLLEARESFSIENLKKNFPELEPIKSKNYSRNGSYAFMIPSQRVGMDVEDYLFDCGFDSTYDCKSDMEVWESSGYSPRAYCVNTSNSYSLRNENFELANGAKAWGILLLSVGQYSTRESLKRRPMRESDGYDSPYQYSDVEEWVQDTIESWRSSWDDDLDGCSQCANDLIKAKDYFFNETNDFSDRYGYDIDENEMWEEDLEEIVDAAIDNEINYMMDTREHFSHLEEMVDSGNTDAYSYEEDDDYDYDDEEDEDEESEDW